MRPFSTLLSALWRYSSGKRYLLVLYISMLFAANISLLLEPYIVGQALNLLQQSATLERPLRSLSLALFAILGINILFWLFHGPARVIERRMAFDVRTQYKDHLFRIITTLPVQWHKDNHSGGSINRIGKATRALYDFTGGSWQIIEMIVRSLGSIVALALIMPTAAAMAFSLSALALGVVFFFDAILLKRYEELNSKDHLVASALHDYVTNIITVITLRLEALTQSELYRRMTSYIPLYQRSVVINEAKWFAMTIAISCMQVATLLWYVFRTVGSGDVPLVGSFFMLYDYLQKIGGSFYNFGWKYSMTVEQYADLLSAEDILSAEPASRYSGLRLPAEWRSIDVSHLHFTYQDEEHRTHHLKNLSFTLQKGKKVALVGESGSGKSTLMALIRGLQVSDRADVMADGVRLPGGLQHLAAHTTLIPQDPEIFASTIEYNISVDTDVPEAELMRDVELAQFSSVLARLPKGLQSDVSEKGVNLSGGEKQRLALARGIFAAKSSDIILLDEPTSSVDSDNERKIYENIFSHFSDRCIVSSIHKLHLLPLFDYIYVISDGEIQEEGSFHELLEKHGRLWHLWEQYQRDVKPDTLHS
mgnify:FL=1